MNINKIDLGYPMIVLEKVRKNIAIKLEIEVAFMILIMSKKLVNLHIIS